jgi:hypothetical protein
MKKKSNQTVRMATPGQIKDIISAVVESIPVNNLTFEKAEYFIGNKKQIGTKVRKIFYENNAYADLISDWQAFYHEMGIDCDLSRVIIPNNPGGFDRVIIMAQGITPQSGYDLCAKNFPCWKYTDKNLDEIIISDRTTKSGAYAIRVRDCVEADEEQKNLSANYLKERNIPGITLEEREIYELKFFKETGKHLDIENWTLCAGSRCAGDHVPYVNRDDDRMSVHWYFPGNALDYLRSRVVVS